MDNKRRPPHGYTVLQRLRRGVVGHKVLKLVFSIAILIVAAAFPAYATDDWGWQDRDGNRVPDSDDMKSVGGFGGWLIVTRDPDWEKEWNTPSEHTPNLTTVDEVRVGEVIAILPVFGNPKPDSNGVVRIHCDLLILRPDESVALDEKDLNCFTYKLTSDPRSVWLSGIIPKFIGEKTDPKGKWEVNVVLRDMVRGVEVSLKTHFTLVNG